MRAVEETPEQTAGRAPRWAPRRSRGQFRRARVKYRDVPKRRMAWLLLKDTVNSCMEYRVLGLAAEAAFFTLISIPPLLLGVIGLLGYLDWIGADTIEMIRRNFLDASATVLSDRGVDQVARPLIDDVIRGGGPDVISLGFALALWSGSRAVNVFIDTITVMYGLDGRRGIVKTRLLAFFLYLVALVIGAVALPLMVAGPDAVLRLVPQAQWVVSVFYWPVVLLLSIVFLTTLYHVSVPVRSPWREDIPGALVALVMWVLGSFLLRLYLTNTVEGPTIYGSLAAPVAVLLWIGVSAFAVLVGAAVNAAIDHVWPSVATAAARRANERRREEAAAEVVAAVAARRRRMEEYEDGDGDPLDPDAPAEFPERWTKFLPPSDVRGRLLRPRGHDRDD
ncbi:YihY/virulence factor BrkB family protein [Streptomyces oryzae]|uniref:YihY/virulence factor BrkB family protein n=2 Tax=Streptomyces oryzae TaxID=1434886 RepID=A0ABS3XGF4_9ACTN|nr:YihY/virulence factor BrkB family protein [Streptomyces oryzae]